MTAAASATANSTEVKVTNDVDSRSGALLHSDATAKRPNISHCRSTIVKPKTMQPHADSTHGHLVPILANTSTTKNTPKTDAIATPCNPCESISQSPTAISHEDRRNGTEVGKKLTHKRKRRRSNKSEPKSQDKTECPFCSKSLQHLDFARRQRHVVRCMVAANKQKSKHDQTAALPNKPQTVQTQRTAIKAKYSCILCEKTLKNEEKWLEHMKKCAKSRNIPHKKLIEMTRCHRSTMADSTRKSKTDDQSAISVQQTLTGHLRRSDNASTNNRTKKRKKTNKRSTLHCTTKEEEDLTLALALSASFKVINTSY